VMADPRWLAGAKMKKLKAADPAAAVVKQTPKVMKPRRDLTRTAHRGHDEIHPRVCRFLNVSHGDQSQGLSFGD